MRSMMLFRKACAVALFASILLGVAAAQGDMMDLAMKAAAKAVAPAITAAKSPGSHPTMLNVDAEAARRQKNSR